MLIILIPVILIVILYIKILINQHDPHDKDSFWN